MSYHLHGVGDWPADTVWNPGPGQAPRNDPRIVKAYSKVYGTWQPSGISQSGAPAAPGYLLAAVKARLPGWTVSLEGNGWVTGGLIRVNAIVPTDTAAGVIKGAFFDAMNDVNAQRTSTGFKVLGTGSVINPIAYINASDIKLPAAATTTTPGTTPPVTPTADGSTVPDTTGITSTVSGIPMWAIGVGAVGVVGLLGYFALSGGKKASASAAPAAPAAAVAANRRRRSYRRAA